MPDFTPSRHRDAINRRGEQIRWWRGDTCTCTKHVTALRNRECAFCSGLGIVYTEQEISDFKALVRDVSQSEILAPYGELKFGDVAITTMPDEIPLGEQDMIELVTRAVYREDVDNTTGTTHDNLRWKPIHSIVEVAVGDDVERVVYNPTEYTFDDDGIVWDSAPAANKTIVVKYKWIPRYIVLTGQVLHRRLVDGAVMPQRIGAKLRGLDYRE